ncbi:MAG: 3-phosphoshikimate 1-carboxyvinyltransferase [Fimbriimonadaceae bacterium]
MTSLTVRRAQCFAGSARPPSDKSLTHRALMLAAIADGPCRIYRPLRGHDPMSTLACMEMLGARAEWQGQDDLTITPPESWCEPSGSLDCGNSGTTLRLLAGLVAGRPLRTTLTGDASLSRRPMTRIAEPLRLMGAMVQGETPPLTIIGRETLRAIAYTSPVASAQVKSCILLAGLTADGPTSVTESTKSRDHTERMLTALGVDVRWESADDGRYTVWVHPKRSVPAFDMTVPADLSSAAFWMVAAAIVEGGRVDLAEVGLNPTRAGIFDVFDQAGLYYEIVESASQLNESTGSVSVIGGHGVGHRPFAIAGPLVPRLIDEIPVLSVLATQLEGTSTIRDAKELRVKETDRIAKMAEGLRAMGARVETFDDGMAITGPANLKGARIDSDGDHRVGMAFAIAGLIADGETTIDGADTIGTSFPEFESELRRLSGR